VARTEYAVFTFSSAEISYFCSKSIQDDKTVFSKPIFVNLNARLLSKTECLHYVLFRDTRVTRLRIHRQSAL